MMPLYGHASPETAHVVNDYPYGYRLRCKIRYWMEVNKKGYRLVSQTTNPKVPGEVWNKPKASIYSDLSVMYLDENGHMQHAPMNVTADLAKIAAYRERFAPLPETETKRLDAMEAAATRYKAIWDARAAALATAPA